MPESRNVVALHSEKVERRKREPNAPDAQRLQLAHETPELALSALEVCAVLNVSRRQLLRLRKLPGFPPAFQYQPGGKNYWRAGQVLQWKREHLT